MKIAFTIADYGAAVHIGAPVELCTHIADVPDELIPDGVKLFIAKTGQPGCHWSMSVSVVHSETKKG